MKNCFRVIWKAGALSTVFFHNPLLRADFIGRFSAFNPLMTYLLSHAGESTATSARSAVDSLGLLVLSTLPMSLRIAQLDTPWLWLPTRRPQIEACPAVRFPPSIKHNKKTALVYHTLHSLEEKPYPHDSVAYPGQLCRKSTINT